MTEVRTKNLNIDDALPIFLVTVATLPPASPSGRLVYVVDESGGSVIAFSDGANWLRSTDRNVVS